MPTLLIIDSPGSARALLEERLAAAGFESRYVADPAAALDTLAAADAPDFVLCGPDMPLDGVVLFLEGLKARGAKALPVVGCRLPLDQERLVACSRLVNHVILDLDDAAVIDKKLSNLKSIARLLEGKQAFRDLERVLQEESSKLVEVNVNNVRLFAEVNEKHKRLELAERDLKNMIENLGQGFCTVDRAGRVQDGSTAAVAVLFGREPRGLALWELLGLDDGGAEQNRLWLKLVFDEAIPFADLVPLGEGAVRVGERYVGLEYRLIRDAAGAVERLIVIATDRTLEKRYEEKSRREEAFAKVILRVVKDKSGFLDFLDESRRLLVFLAETFAAGGAATPGLAACFRAAHTLKGNGSAYGLIEMAERAHVLEDKLEVHRADEAGTALPATARAELAALAAAARAAFDAAVAEIENAVGDLTRTVATRMTIDKGTFDRFEAALFAAHGGAAGGGVDAGLLALFDDSFYHSNFYKHLLRYAPLVSELAERLGKRAKLTLASQAVKVHAVPYGAFIQSFVHLLRNALDHGLETPDERLAAGKPEEGTIAVKVTLVDGAAAGAAADGRPRFRVAVRDDGRGIDVARVRAKAVERGLLDAAAAAALSDAEAMALVLAPGFSTRDEAGEWSGRGVGLDAVARAAADLGGSVEIDSAAGQYTEIACALPVLRKNDERRGGST